MPREIGQKTPCLKDFSVADMGQLVATYSGRVYPRISFLNGFCLMIKCGLIDQIGYLDEERFGEGYGEENDYCLRAAKAGWHLAVADDTYIYHAQSRSYSHERRKQLVAHSDKAFGEKYGHQIISDGISTAALTTPCRAVGHAIRLCFYANKQL